MSDDPIIDSLNPFPEREGETHREARIRRRAYEIWEAAGRPEGREDEHWFAAEREYHLQRGGSASVGTPVTPESIPSVRSPGRVADAGLEDHGETPEAPDMAGAPKPAPDTSRSPIANRDLDGPRKVTNTPRPTRNPIAGV